ncbi:ABC transporter substrate-binding protein [Aeromicrobium sp.]|uniref:ABC transporter substrate-binding protein n=1 Tax=Aeromicrobium sp. TaxID=1871063 RepID=UPI0030BFBD64
MVDNSPLIIPRRTLLKGGAALGGAMLLSACGDSAPKSAGKSITLKDQRGTVLTFDGPVKRIVTLPMPAASIMIAVDRSAARLAGVHDASWAAANQSILGTMFPRVLKVPHDIGTQEFAPNVEGILALDPDVVVQWANQGDEIIQPLENAGLPVLGVNYGKLEDVGSWFRMFSTVLGRPERGRAMATRLDSDRAAVAAVAAKRTGRAPRVLYFNRFSESLTVQGAGTFNEDYVRLIGAENVSSEVKGLVEVDLEQVLDWDPDVIVLGNFDEAMPDDVYGDRRWRDVAAVRARRVYRAPLGGYRWDPPSHESPLMWTWLAQIAFPDGTDGGLRDKIVADYRYFYDHTPTQSEIDTMLWTEANGASADYDQFSA